MKYSIIALGCLISTQLLFVSCQKEESFDNKAMSQLIESEHLFSLNNESIDIEINGALVKGIEKNKTKPSDRNFERLQEILQFLEERAEKLGLTRRCVDTTIPYEPEKETFTAISQSIGSDQGPIQDPEDPLALLFKSIADHINCYYGGVMITCPGNPNCWYRSSMQVVIASDEISFGFPLTLDESNDRPGCSADQFRECIKEHGFCVRTQHGGQIIHGPFIQIIEDCVIDFGCFREVQFESNSNIWMTHKYEDYMFPNRLWYSNTCSY